jgi:glutathione synthase/RimK-type ligase-like ATP-grasp enzyme
MTPSRKIGILFGQEDSFPWAFIDRVNALGAAQGLSAEAVRIDKVIQGDDTGYAVIVDRISQDIPFYRGVLKNAALNGTAVVNNPFWWSADEKFFNNCLATKIGVAVPKTVLLPSKQHPSDTNERSMRNLAYPLDWDSIFSYIGFPAFFKPFAGGGWKNVYKLHNEEEFFRAYDETGQLVMMLQEEIVFREYFRCYCIDVRDVRIMQYDPRAPFHERYVRNGSPVDTRLLECVHDGVLRLNRALGYDFNTVEFAVRDGVPYAIDFCNPAPDADVHSIGEENFAWVVDAAARMAVRKALAHQPGKNSLTWGEFVVAAAGGAVAPAAIAAAAAASSPAGTPGSSSGVAAAPAAEPGPTPVGHLVDDAVASAWHEGTSPQADPAAATPAAAPGGAAPAAADAPPPAAQSTSPAAQSTSPAAQSTPLADRWADDKETKP